MDVLKSAIFTACIIGTVSSLSDMAAPDGKLKKQLGIILTMILILAVFSPFLGNDFKLDFSSADDLFASKEYESLNEDFQNMYLEQSSQNIEEVLLRQMKQQGISVDKVVIVSQLDEYNSLEIKKVKVYLANSTDSEDDRIKEIISENLPDCEIEFVKEDSSEY